MSDDLFEFNDVSMDVLPGGAVASPPSRLSASADHPLGTLFEGSSPYVASEVTGGGRGNEGVRLLLVRLVEDVCGGEIKGGGSVVRFCSKPRESCQVVSHLKSKAFLRADCLYPYVPRKGENQVRLEPSLPLSLVSPDEPLEMLLLEEKSIALWQTYMDACKASEYKTGRRELSPTSTGEEPQSWDQHLEAPNLQELADADDFKTPKKVRIVSGLKRDVDEDYPDTSEIGTIPTLNLDLSTLSPQPKSVGNQALRRIIMEWDSLARSFGILKSRVFSN
jgi:hypothetical protein